MGLGHGEPQHGQGAEGGGGWILEAQGGAAGGGLWLVASWV